jgi:predicted PilT family ATPase
LSKNLYNLAKSFISGRTAILSTNSTQVEKEVTKNLPQGSCCVPAFWNTQYNSLLNLEYGKRTKAIAFADNLIISVRAETVREAENHANIEIRKMSNWAKGNKIIFNQQKSKFMIISSRKRREKKNVSIYLNNKLVEQAMTTKYPESS